MIHDEGIDSERSGKIPGSNIQSSKAQLRSMGSKSVSVGSEIVVWDGSASVNITVVEFAAYHPPTYHCIIWIRKHVLLARDFRLHDKGRRSRCRILFCYQHNTQHPLPSSFLTCCLYFAMNSGSCESNIVLQNAMILSMPERFCPVSLRGHSLLRNISYSE